MADQEVLDAIHEMLSRQLNRIAALFKTGAKITLVIRQPEQPGDTGIVIGNDDYDAAIAEIQKQRVTGTKTGGIDCENNTPRWFHLHWRDWHRGHGCDKDDGKQRSDAAQSLISERERMEAGHG